MKTKLTSHQIALKFVETQKQRELKANVIKLATEQGKPELEIITALQAAAVVTRDNDLLERLCVIKRQYL